jgi:hypothetical protein
MRYPFELWDTDCARHGLIESDWKLSLDITGVDPREYRIRIYGIPLQSARKRE